MSKIIKNNREIRTAPISERPDQFQILSRSRLCAEFCAAKETHLADQRIVGQHGQYQINTWQTHSDNLPPHFHTLTHISFCRCPLSIQLLLLFCVVMCTILRDCFLFLCAFKYVFSTTRICNVKIGEIQIADNITASSIHV